MSRGKNPDKLNCWDATGLIIMNFDLRRKHTCTHNMIDISALKSEISSTSRKHTSMKCLVPVISLPAVAAAFSGRAG